MGLSNGIMKRRTFLKGAGVALLLPGSFARTSRSGHRRNRSSDIPLTRWNFRRNRRERLSWRRARRKNQTGQGMKMPLCFIYCLSFFFLIH